MKEKIHWFHCASMESSAAKWTKVKRKSNENNKVYNFDKKKTIAGVLHYIIINHLLLVCCYFGAQFIQLNHLTKNQLEHNVSIAKLDLVLYDSLDWADLVILEPLYLTNTKAIITLKHLILAIKMGKYLIDHKLYYCEISLWFWSVSS